MDKRKQWHPVFAHLLGLLIRDYYEIQPEVPVGDLPRKSDLLVIRRQPGPDPPFVGLWANLADLNVDEYKGPTDYAEEEDLELLVHVGTGLTLKLNEERQAAKQERLANRDVAFWYLVPTLGEKFLEMARDRLFLTYETGGLWRGKILGHPLFLMAYHDAAVEVDTIPLALLDRALPRPRALAELIARQKALVDQFGEWVFRYQPEVWKEINHMECNEVPTLEERLKVATPKDLNLLLRLMPFEEVARHVPLDRLREAVGGEKILDAILAKLPADKIMEALERRLQKE